MPRIKKIPCALTGHKEGQEPVYYTGRAGEGFVSNALSDAFVYEMKKGAERKAAVFNQWRVGGYNWKVQEL